MTNDKDSAVTQADRDAAAAIACLPHQDKLRSGEWDSDPVIQAFAKHRLAASQPVAWAEGRNAFAEITHYAAVYGQDGPVTIQMKVNGRWTTGRKLEIKEIPPPEGDGGQ